MRIPRVDMYYLAYRARGKDGGGFAVGHRGEGEGALFTKRAGLGLA